jgi:hypothetical protein
MHDLSHKREQILLIVRETHWRLRSDVIDQIQEVSKQAKWIIGIESDGGADCALILDPLLHA